MIGTSFFVPLGEIKDGRKCLRLKKYRCFFADTGADVGGISNP
jgi:hypothetical protein